MARRQAQGFALVELLLAFGLGLGLTAVMLQAVLAEGQNGQRLARVLRERMVAQRALDLLRLDLQRASSATTSAGDGGEAAACGLSGRAVVLHLESPEGPITYTLGKPSEPIWRGNVLMRCGPAFGLDGSPSRGQSLNRVLLDGLAAAGASVTMPGHGALRFELRQQLLIPGQGSSQQLVHQRLLPMP